MLTRLTSAQIGNFWPEIKDTIHSSNPGKEKFTEKEMSNILDALTQARMQAWLAVDPDESTKLDAVIITTVSVDGCSGRKTLWIYGIKAFTRGSDDMWFGWLGDLKSFGRSVGCQNVVGVTKSNSIIKRTLNGLGGDASYTAVNFQCDEELR